MTSTAYVDNHNASRDEQRRAYLAYPSEHQTIADVAQMFADLMLDRDRENAALRDRMTNEHAEHAETLERLGEEHQRAIANARELGIQIGVAREIERVIEQTFAYNRGCDEGKRDFLENQLGYDVPGRLVDWPIEVTITYQTTIEADADSGPEEDDFDSNYVRSQVAGRLGLSADDMSVTWETY